MSGRYVVVTVSFFARDVTDAADTVRDLSEGFPTPLQERGYAVDAATIDGEELEWER